MEIIPKIQDRIDDLEKQVSYLRVLTKPYEVYYIENTEEDENDLEKSPDQIRRKEKIMNLKRLQQNKKQKILEEVAAKKTSSSPQPVRETGKDNYLTQIVPPRQVAHQKTLPHTQSNRWMGHD